MADSERPPKRKLVDFVKPPVNEVILTAQFDGPVVDIAVLAGFTGRVAVPANRISHVPVLPRIDETFGLPPFTPAFQIIESAATLPRTWFDRDEYVIQLQPDRISVNWRKVRRDAAYPGYDVVRACFDEHLNYLMHAVDQAGKTMPAADLCEVTYFNPVVVPDWDTPYMHPDLAAVINRLATAPTGAFLGHPEDSQYQARWQIPHPSLMDQPVGRLYLGAAPQIVPDAGTPQYLVNLTARVLPSVTDEHAYDALDEAHRWVVKGFEDVTTERMHEHWGQRKIGDD